MKKCLLILLILVALLRGAFYLMDLAPASTNSSALNQAQAQQVQWSQATVLSLLSAYYTYCPYPARYALEKALIFHPTEPVKLTEKDLRYAIHFRTKLDDELFGIYYPARPGKETIIMSNGNAGRLSTPLWLAPNSGLLKQGYGFLMYDYPGYGLSPGQPSEVRLYASLEAASDYLLAQGVPISKQIPFGWSMGGAVTIDLAAKRPFKKVILSSTFTSVPEVFRYSRQSAGVPDWLFPITDQMIQRFDSINKIKKSKARFLIVHGEADLLCPIEHSRSLFETLGPKQAKFISYPNLGHSAPLYHKPFYRDLQQFIQS